MAIHVATMNDGRLDGLVPCIWCTCVNEITIKRDATQQPLGSQLREDVTLNGVLPLWHPIKDIVVEDVRTGVDEV